jgi:hypothetical protein
MSLCTRLRKGGRKQRSVGGKRTCEARSPRGVRSDDELDRGGGMKSITAPAHFRSVRGPSWTRVYGPGSDNALRVAS